jgi:hypothetical protein
MIKSGEITHEQTRTELLAAIAEIIDAGRAAGDLRADITADDVAASLLGIFTVAQPREHRDRASRLLDILIDGLRPRSDHNTRDDGGDPLAVPAGHGRGR